MSWTLYILLCDYKNYYIGITSNINNRVQSHKSKRNIATKRYSNLSHVYSEKHRTRKDAEKREIQLKKWSRAKKKALIKGDIDSLKELSKTPGRVDGSNR